MTEWNDELRQKMKRQKVRKIQGASVTGTPLNFFLPDVLFSLFQVQSSSAKMGPPRRKARHRGGMISQRCTQDRTSVQIKKNK